MICPNCGRELPDTARVCPSCNAVQRAYRRRRAEADMEQEAPRAHVARRVTPDQFSAEERNKREQAGEKNVGTVSTPRRVPVSNQDVHAGKSGSRVPVGLEKQAAREHANVRHVRHAPDNLRRKVDAKPAMYAPPIYLKSHKRMIHVLIVILLLTLFVVSAGGYMLFKTENGQQLMAQWVENCPNGCLCDLGKELVDQAYYTRRALSTYRIAVGQRAGECGCADSDGAGIHGVGAYRRGKKPFKNRSSMTLRPAHPSAYRNLIKIYQG